MAFPHISWWAQALSSGSGVLLQTGQGARNADYRNRYRIATANGPLLLTVPVKGGRRNGANIADIPIDYTHSWQRQHWGALYSAYGRAPFYEHYGPELEALIFAGHQTLLEFNLAGLEWLGKAMRLELNFSLGNAPIEERETGRKADVGPARPYRQVFEDRWGFLPDLSAIDLLMAEGPYAKEYLRG